MFGSQTLSEIWPPTPAFTEEHLPDLSSKVYIVTGGASGIGKELCKLLYSKAATVYLAGRSQTNAEASISSIRSEAPDSTGTLKFLNLDLADLPTIKPAAEMFLAQEDRLDVVWHNAGVMVPPGGTKTTQGYELQLGTNAVGPWLFQQFLTPLLQKTAALQDTPKNSVRVIWVASIAHMSAPYPGGIQWSDINFENSPRGLKCLLPYRTRFEKYSQSKAADIILSAEAAKRWAGSGVLSLSLNPGMLRTSLQRYLPGAATTFTMWATYTPYYGALTELFAGLSPDVDESHNGGYIIPWGRFGEPRSDIKAALDENGSKLWNWMEEECKGFM